MILQLKESTEKVYVLSDLAAYITQDGKEQQVSLNPQAINATITTKDLLLSLVNVKQEEGMLMTDVYKKVKLIELIEESEGEIELTDAQFESIKESAQKMKWSVACKSIRDFGLELGIVDSE
jgi:predicted methyltransferase